MVHDGLWDIFNNYHMGITAENLAEKYNITREEQDEFAARSQQLAERLLRAEDSRTKSFLLKFQEERKTHLSSIQTNTQDLVQL